MGKSYIFRIKFLFKSLASFKRLIVYSVAILIGRCSPNW